MQRSITDIRLPGGQTLTLREVAADDDDFLLVVYGSTRAEELAPVPWSPEQKQAFLTMQFNAKRSDYQQRYPDAEYDVILMDQQPVGRLWIGRDENQIRLLDIALLPEAQNKGVGTALLRNLIAEATESRKPLRHMVFVYNSNADRFYERLGFKMIEDLGAYKHMEYDTSNPSIES